MNPTARSRELRGHRRRAAAFLTTVAAMPVMLGVTALAVDAGYMYVIRGDLQNAADAAAMAACTSLTDESNLRFLAERFSRINHAGLGATLDPSDVQTGLWERYNRTFYPGLGPPNGVSVSVQRLRSRGTGVSLFFANALGIGETDLSATAIASVDDRFAGFDPGAHGGARLLPFTKHIDAYDPHAAAGTEAVLWPAGADVADSDIAGNFGTVNFRGNSALVTGDLIDEGVLPSDLLNNLGVNELTYLDAGGSAVTYSFDGTPGLMTSLESNLLPLIGQVIGFFVHDDAQPGGSNTLYRNVGIRFGRVMRVNLESTPAELVVMPAPYIGPGVVTDESAPSTNGQIGRVTLVR